MSSGSWDGANHHHHKNSSQTSSGAKWADIENIKVYLPCSKNGIFHKLNGFIISDGIIKAPYLNYRSVMQFFDCELAVKQSYE